jgi:iron complex outermembrane recepter protein
MLTHSRNCAAAAFALLASTGVTYAQQAPINDSGQTELEEVTVTGIRASVQAAQEIKRDAPSVVEAITLEDLGKFTDSSISDALQRIPGVNVDRNLLPQFGGGDGVSIRGLGPDYGSTTINGRDALGTPDFFGASGRHFDFASVPPDILGGVTIYKTSTSELIEPGMAGQVDLKTLRPLDYAEQRSSDYFGSISASGSKYSGDDRVGPHVNGIVGGRFLDGILGAYLTAADSIDYQRISQFQSYNGQYSFGVEDPAGGARQYNNVWATWGTDSWNPDLKNEKTSFAGDVQFRPNKNLDINLDFIQNHYTVAEDAQADYYQSSGIFNLTPASVARPGAAVIGGTAVPGVSDGGLTYFDTSRISNIIPAGSPNSGSLNYIAPFHDRSDYHYFVGGLNTVWKSDDERWTVSSDVAHSDNTYFTTWMRSYLQNGIGGEDIYNTQGSFPVYTVLNTPSTDILNPNSYTNYGFAEFFQKQNRANRNSYRLDLAGKLLEGLTGKIGANYQASSTRFISMNYDPTTFPTNTANFFIPGTTRLPGFPASIPNASFANFCVTNPAFCNQSNQGRGSFNGGFPSMSGTPGGSGSPFVAATPGDIFDLNTTESYQVKEQTTAFYGQLDFKGDLFSSIKFSGNAGLRAVRVAPQAIAFQGVIQTVGFTTGGVVSSVTAPVEEDASYWEYLPSFNFSLKPIDNLALRLGVSKTISLPTPQQLAPYGTINIVLPDKSGIAQPSQAKTGNTMLRPTRAWNYDVTAEYYTDYGGAYIASVFYKDVHDLIENVTELNQAIPGQGSRLFSLNTTVNGASGHAGGFELGTNQPFTFLPAPWDGFGVQANYTYVDTKTNVNGYPTQFQGSSKDNVNLNAYWEKFGFAARLAYLYRSAYVNDFGYADGRGTGVDVVEPQHQLDASLSYKFREHFELILTGSNLTSQDLYVYSQQGGFLTNYVQRPRSIALAARASF